MNWGTGFVSVNIFHLLSLLGVCVCFYVGFFGVFFKLVKRSSKKGGEVLNMGITRLAHCRHISISWQH